MIRSIFDFGNLSSIEETIKSTWNEFRNYLASGACKYDEVEKAKGQIFLQQFDDYFNKNDCKKHFTKDLWHLVDAGYVFARGTILKDDEIVDYNRFMPISKYISEDNRFSPPGVEWLYLASGYKGEERDRIETAENCTINVCKAKAGNRFGICHFEINPDYYDAKVVDLTIADTLTYEELNNALEEYGQKVRKRVMRVFKSTGIKIPINRNDFIKEFEKWFSYTDAKLISEQLFLPVAVDEKKYMYAPFQCMAKYFEALGYSGIVFSSTVYPKAKNLVLFDKNMAIASGDIIDFIVE